MMIIRPEHVSDYAAIGELHACTFGNRSAEAVIVTLLRQRRAFDPELSLVAEINGRVIGHALFSPYQMRLLGQTIPAVNLAPIAVDPAYQGQGIGGQLITQGHTLAAAKGHTANILLGHSGYYPRFGYHTHAFGHATSSAWDASMACSLGPSPLDDYLARLQRRQRPPGRVTWPIAFDLS